MLILPLVCHQSIWSLSQTSYHSGQSTGSHFLDLQGKSTMHWVRDHFTEAEPDQYQTKHFGEECKQTKKELWRSTVELSVSSFTRVYLQLHHYSQTDFCSRAVTANCVAFACVFKFGKTNNQIIIYHQSFFVCLFVCFYIHLLWMKPKDMLKSMQSNNKAATQNVTNVLGSHFYCIFKNMIRFRFRPSNQK